MPEQWTPEDARDMLINPVYVIGKSPMVPKDQWVSAQRKLLKELGEEEYFKTLIRVMKATFGEFVG